MALSLTIYVGFMAKKLAIDSHFRCFCSKLTVFWPFNCHFEPIQLSIEPFLYSNNAPQKMLEQSDKVDIFCLLSDFEMLKVEMITCSHNIWDNYTTIIQLKNGYGSCKCHFDEK